MYLTCLLKSIVNSCGTFVNIRHLKCNTGDRFQYLSAVKCSSSSKLAYFMNEFVATSTEKKSLRFCVDIIQTGNPEIY